MSQPVHRPAPSSTALSLAQVNALTPSAFVNHFGGVLEHSPQYAQAAAAQRPFASDEEIACAFAAAVQADTPAAQLDLIRAHPDLAGKAALAGELTPESASEQASAGLGQLSTGEFAEFQQLNSAYHTKFGLPYVVCVREHTKASIFEGARTRLSHTPEQERAAALHEISRIARLRVLDLVQ
ncbi:2-oxo-4-hydroxy-4-carboxy-5-ureidoimidazoline decarboxylase [Deinococcus rubellus]|uniref:2-oxo-4-hydroxy-4-carboxy-5-ureidoimidazoline decarboxylase n=1 Tax=Deinococcus rubellus TaxID=1889240 RepID=UPI0031E7F1DB